MKDLELSVVVPTRNEADNIEPLLARIEAALRGVSYEVIVVDDSDDGTPCVVERYSHDGYPVRLIHREGPDRAGGLSSAVVAGFRAARGEYIGCLDADLQHPPEKIQDLVAALARADVAVASRYLPGGCTDGLAGPGRRLGSLVAKGLAWLLISRARLSSDPLSGFFVVRRATISGVDLRPVGFKILLEVLARGRVQRVADVPYQFQPRHLGRSKANVQQMKLYIQHLARLRFGIGDQT